jgi:single-stranded DNA-binding protein
MFKTIITGRLGSDCKIKEIGNDQKKYIAFPVACTSRVGGDTVWVDVMYRSDSEKVADYLKKGRQVGLVGHLTVKAETYNNQPKARITLWADDLELLGDNKD